MRGRLSNPAAPAESRKPQERKQSTIMAARQARGGTAADVDDAIALLALAFAEDPEIRALFEDGPSITAG